jgi:hypothetical protein
MPLPSKVLGSGNSGMSTLAICGEARTGLTALGTNLATALQLTAEINNVTTVALSTGVALPSAEASGSLVIVNNGANPLTVYARTGQTVMGAASVTIAATKATAFYAVSPTVWLALAGA